MNRSPVTIQRLEHRDVAALERHVAFEREHGIARFDAEGLRAWLPTVEAALLLAAVDERGELAGCATASRLAVFPGSVQLNAFCRLGEPEVLRLLTDEVARWEAPTRARELLAHVSGPTEAAEEAWLAAGFERVATRSRVERAVSDLDRTLPTEVPAGLRVAALRDRPDLVDAALRVWNRSHADIPTVLPFAALDLAGWRRTLALADGEPYPPGLLVAVDDEGRVVGVGCLALTFGSTSVADHRFTGVERGWRGRGLARALKIELIRWAAANGVARLRASTDSGNASMLAVNARLGYVESFRVVMFRRALRPGD
ncbi:MAG: GNAT family N-acetyltransferase [Deltaproteobacteria bacterium]|nr:GNAT family N-acetyltransferase [Myxococcales bacterium]MDP3220714.1 GNAT family N-acetyltransferase [Deltaproteobacteria bacterium]